MTRPNLKEVSLDSVWPPKPGTASMTMSAGQWDTVLLAAYDLGFVLFELDEDEKIVRAYRRELAA
jgi:hypothetical protein